MTNDTVTVHRAPTPRDVSEVLGLSEKTVYKLIASGEIPSMRYGRQYRVPYTWLRSQLEWSPDTEGEEGDAGC